MSAPDLERLLYPPPFMDLATLARHICSGESTIENWVKMGQFPAPRMQGGKRLWRWKEVEKHLAGDGVASAASEHDQRLKDITNAGREASGRRN